MQRVQNVLYEIQLGFRNNSLTMHRVTQLTKNISQASDSGKFICRVFIDLKNLRTFDTVNHNIILRKMEYYGIRGVSNTWFKSYSTDKKQHSYHGGIISDDKVIGYGIPQWSVLVYIYQ